VQRDAADRQQPVDLFGGEAAGGLVGGDAVLVQAASLGPRVEQRDVMALAGQTVGAGQAGGSGADHGDLAAGARAAREQRRTRLGKVRVGGVALQTTDLDRLAFVVIAHAGLLAQHLGRADAAA